MTCEQPDSSVLQGTVLQNVIM